MFILIGAGVQGAKWEAGLHMKALCISERFFVMIQPLCVPCSATILRSTCGLQLGTHSFDIQVVCVHPQLCVRVQILVANSSGGTARNKINPCSLCIFKPASTRACTHYRLKPQFPCQTGCMHPYIYIALHWNFILTAAIDTNM